ncbi:hypothetical protein E2C01_043196 [Portunus trituberculatus]|uniref:Uncharacterized protein n=1 Tax=Portunus trituberculatus TaxID=210409 RepID=A0A5B7FVG0_PORTR|nr:hypothetical protein [Portunus trituberculatus]
MSFGLLTSVHPGVSLRCVRLQVYRYLAGHGHREPTRQVEVTFTGQLPPDSHDLGWWSMYSVRRFSPKLPRCFICQGFGDIQRHCGSQLLYGVCSGRHPTRVHQFSEGCGHNPACLMSELRQGSPSKLCSGRWRLPLSCSGWSAASGD